MTLFGQTLAPEQIASLAFLLMALVLWIMVYRGERSWTKWFRGWEAERKARREAEIRSENGEPRPPTGPWG